MDPTTPLPAGTSFTDVVTHLRATDVFARLEPGDLATMAPLFSRASYPPGTLLAGEGEIDGTLWVVVRGTVALQRHRPDGGVDQLGLRGYGGVIGLRGVLTGTARTHAAITAETTELLYLDGLALWEFLRASPAFQSALVLPENIRANLREPLKGSSLIGEFEANVFRRHWIAVAPRLLLLPVLCFAAFTGLAVLASLVSPSPPTMFSLAGVGLALSALFAAWLYLDYRADQLIVSNRRIIHVERTPLIDVRQSVAQLDRVQDINVVQPSLISKVLDYGDITIQTAGTRGAMRFTMVPHPARVRQAIFDQMRAAKETAHRERQLTITRKILTATGRAPAVVESTEARRVATQAVTPARRSPFARLRRAAGLMWTSREDEAGRITWRKHWWVLLRHGWLPIGLWIVLGALLAWWGLQGAFGGLAGMTTGAAGAGTAAGATTGAAGAAVASYWRILLAVWLLVSVWAWWRYEDWRNDIYQLTDDHVIDIERLPLGFFEERRQASLAQVQDVRFVVPNPLARLLNYGSVVIQTAAEGGSFTFNDVHRPASVQEKIFMRMDQRQARLQQAEENRRDEEILRWVSTYHQLVTTPPPTPGPGALGPSAAPPPPSGPAPAPSTTAAPPPAPWTSPRHPPPAPPAIPT